MNHSSSSYRGDGIRRHTVITGGCGLLGTRLARRLATEGKRVRLLDNLACAGADDNLDVLRGEFGDQLVFQIADVRDPWSVEKALRGAEAVFHLADQPPTAHGGPKEEFQVGVEGTLNVLEALRALPQPMPLVFASTCRVYRTLDDHELLDGEDGWRPAAAEIAAHGVSEDRPVDGYGPHACAKTAADQYVRDYARSFGLPAVVLRLSTLCGDARCPGSGAGWVGDLLAAILAGRPVTVPGIGRRVSDLLFLDDAVEALLAAAAAADRLAGGAYNVGGGPANAVSARGLVHRLSALRGEPLEVDSAPPHPAEPRYFTADTRRFQSLTGWRPETALAEGLATLVADTWPTPAEPRSKPHEHRDKTPDHLPLSAAASFA